MEKAEESYNRLSDFVEKHSSEEERLILIDDMINIRSWIPPDVLQVYGEYLDRIQKPNIWSRFIRVFRISYWFKYTNNKEKP